MSTPSRPTSIAGGMVKKIPNPGASVKHLDTIPTETVEENLDDVLQTVKQLDVRCAFTKCKMKTNLMGQTCEFCHDRFCYKHGLPEIHGCGEAVRREERRKFLHPEPAKTVRQREDLAKAKNKLHAKLNNMNQSRKQKQTGANKSKK